MRLAAHGIHAFSFLWLNNNEEAMHGNRIELAFSLKKYRIFELKRPLSYGRMDNKTHEIRKKGSLLHGGCV
jgi:hypothetical protein